MPTWKIALIGAGAMAREHARAFAALPDVEIAGVVGRSPERAGQLADDFDTSSYPTIDALWQATRADAVVIAVPPLAVKSVCEQAFRHPWAALVEKPIGLDLAEAIDLEQLQAKTGTPVFAALNRRHLGATRQMLAELEQIAGPRLITVVDHQDLGVAQALGHPEAVLRTWMYANSIHLLDYFTFVARGAVTSVQVSALWTPEAPQAVVATIGYDSGDIGVYQGVWNGPGPWQVTVGTPQARFDLRPLERLSIQRAGSRLSEPQPADPNDSAFKPGFAVQAQKLVQFLETGDCDLPTLDEAGRTMRLIESVYFPTPNTSG